MSKKYSYLLMVVLIFSSCLLSSCAAALIAGGVTGGYMLAKDMEDGHLIDTPKKKEDKNWFGKKD